MTRRAGERPLGVPRNPIGSSCQYEQVGDAWLIYLASGNDLEARILIARAPTRELATFWACEWCHDAEMRVAVTALDGLTGRAGRE